MRIMILGNDQLNLVIGVSVCDDDGSNLNYRKVSVGQSVSGKDRIPGFCNVPHVGMRIIRDECHFHLGNLLSRF